MAAMNPLITLQAQTDGPQFYNQDRIHKSPPGSEDPSGPPFQHPGISSRIPTFDLSKPSAGSELVQPADLLRTGLLSVQSL